VLLCTYHQYYDVLLVGAGVVPVIVMVDRSWPMLPSFIFAATAAAASIYSLRDVVVPVCLAGAALCSAIALHRTTQVRATGPGDAG